MVEGGPTLFLAQKPFRNSRTALAEVHTRVAVRDDLATNALRATEEEAVFGAHP